MGIQIRYGHLYTLCFADGRVVVAQSGEGLTHTVKKVNEEYTMVGLEINIKMLNT